MKIEGEKKTAVQVMIWWGSEKEASPHKKQKK